MDVSFQKPGPDGNIVNGNSNSRQLNLNNGNPDKRNSDNGPRSEVLAKTHFLEE